MKIKDVLRTRELDLHNSRIGQCSDHLFRATKDLRHAVRHYNTENDEQILVNEIIELVAIRHRIVQLVEQIDKTINPF